MTRAPRFKAQSGGEAEMTSHDYSGQMRPEHMHYTNQPYAQDEYDHPGESQHYDAAAPAGSGIGRALNVVGAVASLALVAGVAVWGYKLVMRTSAVCRSCALLKARCAFNPKNPAEQPPIIRGWP